MFIVLEWFLNHIVTLSHCCAFQLIFNFLFSTFSHYLPGFTIMKQAYLYLYMNLLFACLLDLFMYGEINHTQFAICMPSRSVYVW